LPAFAGKVPPARPNVVLFLADNLPAFMLGCYGNKEIRTPHIDLLCQTGTRFLRNYACTPAPEISRATLLTGLTPMQLHESGAIMNGSPTLESALQTAGYATHTAGPADASVFLESQTAAKPFFLTVNHTTLRPPYDGVAAKYHDLYSGQKFEGYAPDPASPNARAGREMLSDVIGNVRKYAAALTQFDDQVGEIMGSLQRRSLLANSLVVFTSTCGSNLGRHGIWGAGDGAEPSNVYEESINTPLLWSWLGRTPAVAVQVELVSSYDLVPTLHEALSLAPPANLCGKSYLWMATGKSLPKKVKWRAAVCGHHKDTDYARVERYKVVFRNGQKGPNETYDFSSDPHEQTNLADNEQYVDVRNSLGGEIAKWKQGYSA
jgi:arylsulfatase A-like enzyme